MSFNTMDNKYYPNYTKLNRLLIACIANSSNNKNTYRTFIWDSEASIKAHVHCVIIGFSRKNGAEYQKKLYSKDDIIVAKNINGYLLDADNISIEKRMKPLSNVPPISLGGQAIDPSLIKYEFSIAQIYIILNMICNR